MREAVAAEVVDVERVESEPAGAPVPGTLAPPDSPQSRNVQRTWTRIVTVLLFVTLVKQLVLVVAYPPFQGHDEVAHLGYLRTIANDGRLPTFSDRLPSVFADYSRFTLDWPALYTANHPPLYYVMALPAYALAGGDVLSQLYAARLVAVPLFLLTIWLTYLIARTLFPVDDFIVISAPAVVAFQPQLGFEGAIVNNDMLAIALGTLLLYLCVRALRHGLSLKLALVLGVVCGLGLLSKATLLALLPAVAAVGVWLRWPRPWEQVRDADWWRGTGLRGLAIVGPTVALALPWYLYVRRTYGDFTAFEATQELQGDWNRPAGTFTELLLSGSFHEERIHETWGYFGWRLLPLGSGELTAIYVAMAICGVGAVVGLVRAARSWRTGERPARDVLSDYRVAGVALLFAASALMYGATIYFGTMFLLTQARYFFPVLPAAIVLALAGLRQLVPEVALRPATVTVVVAAGAFQTLILTRQVLPYGFL